jgi:hypothetical protein
MGKMSECMALDRGINDCEALPDDVPTDETTTVGGEVQSGNEPTAQASDSAQAARIAATAGNTGSADTVQWGSYSEEEFEEAQALLRGWKPVEERLSKDDASRR